VHLGQLLVAALAEVSELRPWLPSLSPRDTALKYVGLYLKAHNARSPAHVRDKYTQRLQLFTQGCAAAAATAPDAAVQGDVLIKTALLSKVYDEAKAKPVLSWIEP
ncbi:hypothetical protein T492DRAFT_889858, partial [Pavlovales sp. CCMP2436]